MDIPRDAGLIGRRRILAAQGALQAMGLHYDDESIRKIHSQMIERVKQMPIDRLRAYDRLVSRAHLWAMAVEQAKKALGL